MSRGRPKSKLNDFLFEKFELFRNEIIQNEKIVSPSANIWSQFDLGNHYMTSKAVYSSALRWFSKQCENITKDNLECEQEMSIEMSSFVSKQDSPLNSSTENESSITKFSITLSHEVWKTIKPVQT